jgi:hypothetical protein
MAKPFFTKSPFTKSTFTSLARLLHSAVHYSMGSILQAARRLRGHILVGPARPLAPVGIRLSGGLSGERRIRRHRRSPS